MLTVLVYQMKSQNGRWYYPDLYTIADDEDLNRCLEIVNTDSNIKLLDVLIVGDNVDTIDISKYVDKNTDYVMDYAKAF